MILYTASHFGKVSAKVNLLKRIVGYSFGVVAKEALFQFVEQPCSNGVVRGVAIRGDVVVGVAGWCGSVNELIQTTAVGWGADFVDRGHGSVGRRGCCTGGWA